MGVTIIRQQSPRIRSRPFLTLAANTTVMVAPPNPDRHEIEIHSRSTNGNGASAQIRIGDNTIGLSRGRPLQSGETVTYDTKDAIFAWTGSNGQVVCITEFIK